MDLELLRDFFLQAIEAEASDIHLKPDQPPVYRLEGELYKAESDPIKEHDLWTLINEILPPKLKQQFDDEQQVDFAWNFRDDMRFRVNLFSSGGQPTMALRYVKAAIHTFEDLHLPTILGKIASNRRGIVLVGGTTGSGKSTTLAAMIQSINAREFRRIITIEDPIEYIFDDRMSMISQREVGFDTPDFKTGLKNALRQDPDVIMIGELRDRDSVETAMAAAETGHLIFSTVHTDNSATSVTRIMDMFPQNERDQVRHALATTLKAMISQRLVPDLDGRIRPAMEIMLDAPLIKKLIRDGQSERLSAAIESGNEDGMISFNQYLYKMVQNTEISEETALAHASNVESMKMNLKGIFLETGSRIVGGD
ncbi:MAG: pilus retraction protein PilT [Kiritimatiellia bacterium]|jgi:pilus retraction protein PilT